MPQEQEHTSFETSLSQEGTESPSPPIREPSLQELLTNQEHYLLNPGVVVCLAGLSGSFKSTTKKALAYRCNLPEEDQKGIGDIRRSAYKIVNDEQDIVGAAPRPLETDFILDGYTLYNTHNMQTQQRSGIIEGRTSAYIAKEPKLPLPVILAARGHDMHFTQKTIDREKVFGVLIHITDPYFRYRGIARREEKAGHPTTPEIVALATREREANDQQQWKDAYGVENVFDPELRTTNGKKVYDYVVELKPKLGEIPDNFSYAIDFSRQICEALVAQGLAQRVREVTETESIHIYP